MISWLLAPGTGPCGLRGLLLAAGPLGDKGINRPATRQVESTGADPWAWLCSARLGNMYVPHNPSVRYGMGHHPSSAGREWWWSSHPRPREGLSGCE